jgi:hypothetical protein
MEVVQGKVDRIWTNTTKKGNPYCVFEIGGERYSLWDKNSFSKYKEGDEVEFGFVMSHDYKNIVEFYDGSAQESGDGKDQAQEKGPYKGNGNDRTQRTETPGNSSYQAGGPELPTDDGFIDLKTLLTVRMSSVKSAVALYSGRKAPYKELEEKAMDSAIKFEKYIMGGLSDTTPELGSEIKEQQPPSTMPET